MQERLRALGVAAPSDAPAVDTTVADRLEQEKAEAAKKAADADEELKAKELERKARLERERLKGIAVEQAINDYFAVPEPASLALLLPLASGLLLRRAGRRAVTAG